MRLWASRWDEVDDGIAPEDAAAFFDEDAWWGLPKETLITVASDDVDGHPRDTRTGDLPYWTPETWPDVPESPFGFLFQIGNTLHVDASPERLAAAAAAAEDEAAAALGLPDAYDTKVQVATMVGDGTGFLLDASPDDPEPRLASPSR